MTHVNDEQLVLRYYGEDRGNIWVTSHLHGCARCASAYDTLARTLSGVTAPPLPIPNATLPAEIWQSVRERAAGRNVPAWTQRPGATAATLLVWVLPLLYPFAPRALFQSAAFARADHAILGAPLMLLALAWAFAGPFIALFVLNRIRRAHINRIWHRLVVYGAVAATISPALFNLTQRTRLGLPIWYAAIALIAAAAGVPLTESHGSTLRLRQAHRRSAVLILIFAAAHLVNHMFAIVSVPTHSEVLGILRLVYRQSLIEFLLFAAIVLQIGSGAALVWQTHLRRPSMPNTVQALSGLYLAVFFLAHISAAIMARPQTDTNFVWAAGSHGLLASGGLTYLLPYYLLGVAALLAHVGQFLRRRVLASLPTVSLQRWSYAGMALSAVMLLTIGLALCGIAVVR
jgi:hypothetical protein